MNKKDNDRQDSREIRVNEYNPDYMNTSGYSSSDGGDGGQNLNYYQRLQQERKMENEGQSRKPDNGRGDYSQPSQNAYYPPDTDFPDTSDKDDTYPYGGDDYDFGRTPRKKKSYYDDDRAPKKKRRKKKRHPVRHFFLVLLVILIVLFLVIFFFLHLAFSRLTRVDPVADTTADAATEEAGVTPYSENGVMNILLIGQDARDGETQTRSDTMIIASLNAKTHQIALTSLMRDMYVPIAGYDSNKLNAAYFFGGMETLDETVQEDFGIDINGNAVVDFDGFLAALTSVGNLDISLTQEEADYLNRYPGLGSSDDTVEGVVWNLKAGVNNMTPAQVLAYSRMRYVGNSDFDRTARQRNVIQTAFAKLKKNPFQMLSVMNQAAPSITTDMTDGALTKACFYALFCGGDMTTNIIPGDGMYTTDSIDGMDVLIPDLTACHQALLAYIYQGTGTQGQVAGDTDVNQSTVTDSGTNQDDYDAGTEAENPNAGQWTAPSDTNTDTDTNSGSYPADDYITDPRTGKPALDLDHDGIPDYWGDTW